MRPSLEAEWALIRAESDIRIAERLREPPEVTLGAEQYTVERRGVTQGGIPRHFQRQAKKEQACTLY